MAKILKADGSVIDVEPENGLTYEWQQLHDIVGGYIELVTLNNKEYMVVNEEGKLYNLPFNAVATEMYHKSNPRAINDFIVGDVLVCYQDEIE